MLLILNFHALMTDKTCLFLKLQRYRINAKHIVSLLLLP